jgi:hypothetical protein
MAIPSNCRHYGAGACSLCHIRPALLPFIGKPVTAAQEFCEMEFAQQ